MGQKKLFIVRYLRISIFHYFTSIIAPIWNKIDISYNVSRKGADSHKQKMKIRKREKKKQQKQTK